MTDESGPWTVLNEPSREEFEAAEEEELQVGRKGVLLRILRLVAVLLVILALLVYFIVPFNNVFSSVPFHWRRPDTGPRRIPLAPEQRSNPKLPG